jgi:hypothetical protein
MKIVINESDLKKVINTINSEEHAITELKERYSNMSDDDKELCVSLIEYFNPHLKLQLNEAEWYNTVLDILGVVDPTPIVDTLNGISYLKQGDKFYAMLSFISAVPLVGDVIGKGFMLAGRGSKVVKSTDAALKLANKGTPEAISQATKMIENIGKENGLMAKLLGTVRQWVPKLIDIIDNIPLGKLGQPLKNTVKDWLRLFSKAGAGSAKAVGLAKTFRGLTKTDAIKVLTDMKSAVKADTRLFREFGGTAAKGLSGMKNYKMSGMPRLFGNKATRSLMRRTKLWTGFLDYIGVGNFVGPDETIRRMGPKEFNEKMEEYAKTAGAKKNWEDDFKDVPEEEGLYTEPNFDGDDNSQPSKSSTNYEEQGKNFLTNLLFGPITSNVV